MFASRTTLPALAAAIAMTMFQTAAFAQPGQAPVAQVSRAPVAQISYAGLDLASAQGQQELDGRIERAVKSVCVSSATRSISQRQLEQACVAETRAAIGVIRDQLVANAVAGQGRTASAGERAPAID